MGRFEYPYWDLENALDVIKAIHKMGGSAKLQTIADALQMTESGGAFRTKIAAAKVFALIAGKGTVFLTSIAKKILQPIPPETPSQGLREAFLSVPLYKRLYEKFLGVGNQFPDRQTLQHLVNREFGVPQKVSVGIVGAFLKSVEFSGISSKTATENTLFQIQPMSEQAVSRETSSGTVYFKMSLTGFGESVIPIETQDDWIPVQLILDSLKAKWKKKFDKDS